MLVQRCLKLTLAIVLYSCSSTAPNWTPDPTMSKQNSKVRVNFSGLQTEQAEFLVCNYLNKNRKKSLSYCNSKSYWSKRFRQVSNPEDYLGLLDFCDIAALPKNYALIRIHIAIFCISWVFLLALIFLVTFGLIFIDSGIKKGGILNKISKKLENSH